MSAEAGMDLYAAMSTLRAVRRLRPDPIPEATVARLLQAATWAPTGGNVQPWRMVAVSGAEPKATLGRLYEARWRAYAAHSRERVADADEAVRAATHKALDAGDYLAAHLHEAPLIAVFCFDPRRMAITDIDQDRPTVVGGGSVYPAVQNFLLAARAEGLGCVLTTLLCYDEPEVKALLGIPGPWGTCAHVPVGWPVRGGHGPITRRPVADMVYRDHWGTAWD
ncbi:MAG TPA: nitroreductase family protein [Pseudomonadales bacterium]|nr:nitroreductase family protein [Pseudomonadales bacterium]